MKALGGINTAQNNTTDTQPTAPPAASAPEKNAPKPAEQIHYNPMAEILERHETAINKLKRGK